MHVTDLRDADSVSVSQSEDRKELAAVLRTGKLPRLEGLTHQDESARAQLVRAQDQVHRLRQRVACMLHKSQRAYMRCKELTAASAAPSQRAS